MKKLCTNFNNKILEEMEKLVTTCNNNELVIQEVKFTNDSVNVCEIMNPLDTYGLLSVDLKVVIK